MITTSPHFRACAPLIIGLAAITGCTPLQVKPMPNVTQGPKATVVIYRESAYNLGGVPMIVGLDGNDYLELYNREFTKLTVPAGNHELFLRSNQADRPKKLAITLAENESRCFKGFADPQNYVKAFVGITYYLTSAYVIVEMPCALDIIRQNYKWVSPGVPPQA